MAQREASAPSVGVSCPPTLQTQPNFTLNKISENRAASPEPKAGQLHALLGCCLRMRTPAPSGCPRRQRDPKSRHRPAPKSDSPSEPAPKKTPTARATRTAKKSAILQPRYLSKTNPNENGTCSAKTFPPGSETAQTLKACKSTEQARAPASRLWRMSFERATDEKTAKKRKNFGQPNARVTGGWGDETHSRNGQNPKPRKKPI